MATRSESPKQPTPKQEAVNENTSQERLRELAGVSTELARIVAKNPNADPDLLRELGSSSDESTRKGVTANPNTPSDVLLKLGAQFPGQLLDNPVFSLLLLENPNLLADMPVATLRSLLKRDVVPEGFLEWAAGSSDEGVLLAVAMNPTTPRSALEKLIQSRNTEVVEAAKLHVNLVGEMSEGWDDAAIAAMKSTRLERNRDSEAKLWVVGAIPKIFLSVLHEDVRCKIANDPNTPASELIELSKDDDRHSKVLALAQNPSTPLSLLNQLVGDNNQPVREAAAQNPKTPFASLQQFQLQLGTVEHPHTDSDTLRELAVSQWAHIRLGVAGHVNTPQDALDKLAQDQDPLVRMAVALNINTPVSALEKLVTDRDPWLRKAVGCHPNASANLLIQLAEDAEDHHAREAVALNPNSPTSLLEELAKDSGYLVSIGLAQNPNTPVRILKQLGQYPNGEVQRRAEFALFGLARNPNTPISILEQLEQYSNSQVQTFASSNLERIATSPQTDSETLRMLAISQSVQIRYSVAGNQNTPVDVLEQFAQDKDPHIRLVTLLNINFSGKASKQLAIDASTNLIEELKKKPNVLMYMAQATNTPVFILEQLTQYPDVQVQRCAEITLHRVKVQKNWLANYTQATPPNILKSLVSEIPTRMGIPENMRRAFFCLTEPPITDNPELLSQMAESPNKRTRYLVAMNPATPISALQHIAFKDEQWTQKTAMKTLTQNSKTPGEVLQQLVKKADRQVGVAIALHPNTPVAALEELVNTTDWRVHSVVAKNPKTSVTALEKLAREDNWKVREVVAQNYNTPAIALEELLQDKDKYVRAAAIANPNTPKNLLEQIEHLNSPKTPGDRLAELATSEWLIIRERVALHPNTPVSLLEELAKDKNSAIRLAVAQNPNTLGSILEQLLDDKVKEVAIAIAANPNTPVSLLEELAQKKTRNKELQEAAIKNIFSRYPDKAVALLEGYLKSFKPSFTRLLVFLNPQAPSSFLAKNFRSSSWLERYAIAQNPNTPPHTLKFLAQDGNRIVRAATSANLQQRNLV